jgi:hypothetical protein
VAVPERPPVSLVGGTSPLPPSDALTSGDDAPPRRPWPLLLAVLLVVAVALLSAVRPDAPPDRAGDLAVELVVVPDGVTVSQQGVLVVPLEMRNLGSPLQVARAQAFAEPVRLDADLQAPPALAADETRRLVALLAPDCRLLRVQTGLTFRASVLVRVTAGSAGKDVVLDLGADPVVAERVAGLCGQVGVRG